MSDALELATRALEHFNEGTTDCAPSQMRIPLSAYTDESRFVAESRAVFLESPIAIALSLEVPEPGAAIVLKVKVLHRLLHHRSSEINQSTLESLLLSPRYAPVP